MTEMQLQKGQNILSKIKENQSVLNYFLDDEGLIKATEKDSIEILVRFLKECRNLGNDALKAKLALSAVSSIVINLAEENKNLQTEFKNL